MPTCVYTCRYDMRLADLRGTMLAGTMLPTLDSGLLHGVDFSGAALAGKRNEYACAMYVNMCECVRVCDVCVYMCVCVCARALARCPCRYVYVYRCNARDRDELDSQR